ncbi:15-cis-phytoene desaturase [bacterium HR29]|jgi:squalene-associated FAD-dependent desaturase|nr:15-cis-phytoene desaturase [bacterium HR29]
MNVAVIGAGLAGLAAACELVSLGHRVVLFEKRPWAGGKTYSFVDEETGEEIDNGQHVFMRCTVAYRSFLRRLGTERLAMVQPRLSVTVLGTEGRPGRLWADPVPVPFHLARAFLRYPHLTMSEKTAIARALLRVWRMPETERLALRDVSFAEWLRASKQPPGAVERFWQFVTLPTLNCRTEEASAADALFVFREALLRTNDSAALGIPDVGLSRLHVEPALAYVRERGGEVLLRTAVQCLEVDGETAAAAVAGRRRFPIDAAVVAVPHEAAAGLFPEAMRTQPPLDGLRQIASAPIVNVHLWFDRPVLRRRFAATLHPHLQWVFRRSPPGEEGQHLVVSLSGAREELELSKSALQRRTVEAMEAVLHPPAGARLLRCVVVKEPAATFVPSPGLRRPGPATPLRNVVLAGAYVDTGWPATMESAVRSGILAARLLHNRMRATEGARAAQEV